MAFKVNVDIRKEFDVPADYDQVFAVLSTVPDSASHFPKVDQLVDLGDNSYRWEMEKIGIQKYYLQTVYACKYESDKDSGSITWKPISDVGNAEIEGSWKVTKQGDRTHIELNTKGVMTLPFPGLAKMVIGPFASREFESMVNQYIENLKKAFNG
ncbi:MAG: SRPBCC family protein [Candidatus Magnetomorum sp.]|nr:SRPBCC family protein [Candidatus Magnetomorum sp.]